MLRGREMRSSKRSGLGIRNKGLGLEFTVSEGNAVKSCLYVCVCVRV
jgi:hypothetical protein